MSSSSTYVHRQTIDDVQETVDDVINGYIGTV